MHSKANALGVRCCPSLFHALRIRIERVDALSPCGGEPGQATLAAADVEDPGVFERHKSLDPAWLRFVQVGDVHA